MAALILLRARAVGVPRGGTSERVRRYFGNCCATDLQFVARAGHICDVLGSSDICFISGFWRLTTLFPITSAIQGD